MVKEYYEPIGETGSNWNWTWAQARMLKLAVLYNKHDRHFYRIPERIVDGDRELILEAHIDGEWVNVGTNPHLSDGWGEARTLDLSPKYMYSIPIHQSIWHVAHCLGVQVKVIKAPINMIKKILRNRPTFIEVEFNWKEWGMATVDSKGMMVIEKAVKSEMITYDVDAYDNTILRRDS